MANQFIPLPAPAADGPGPAVDVSTFGLLKTITYLAPSGTFPFKPTVIIEFSNEFVPVNFAPLAVIGQPNEIVIPVAAHWMRVTVANYKGGGAPIVNVGGNDLGASFVTLVAPPGSGAGAGVDTSSLGATKTIHVATAFRGVLNIEISEDGGATYNQVCSFYGPGHKTLAFSADFMRATRAGVPQLSAGTPIINIGAVSDGNAGIIVEDEGVALGLFATMNFVGAGVTATDVAGVATITIPGGAAGAGTLNTIAKWTAPATLGDSLLTDDGTTFRINVNKFTVASASGNTAIAGTLNVAGAVTASANLVLVGSLTANATPSTNNTEVLQVIGGVPQWGPLSTAGGVTGTGTINRVAKWTSASAIGDTAFPIDDAAGTLTLGDNTATDLISISAGQTTFTSTQGTGSANSFTWTPVASTISQLAAINITANGTFDTTAGNLSTRGINVAITSTRSAGANVLVNRAALFTASGAQTNVALSTNDGDVTLNTVSGVTTIGFSTATDAALTVSGRSALTSTLDTKNAMSVTWTPVAGTTSGRGVIIATNNGTFDTTAGAISPYAIFGNVTATKSAGGNSLTNTGVSGTATGGDDNRGLSGNVTGSGTTNYSVFAQTTTTGTSNFGITATATGAGTTNIAGNFSATNATTNIAIRALSGDIYLNQTSGNTGIGVASGGIAATEKLRIASAPSAVTTNFDNTRIAATGTFDTTAGTLTGRGLIATATSTRSAGGSNLTNIAGEFSASGAQVNVALQTDSGDVKLNNTAGVATIGFSIATTNALGVSGSAQVTSSVSAQNGFLTTWTPVGGTTSALGAVRGLNNGTFDTTGGAIGAAAVTGTITATKSAGGSGLTNYGVRGIASGSVDNNYGTRGETTGTGTANVGAYGQATGAGTTNWGGRFTATGAGTNIALQTDSGNVLLNNTAGTMTIGFSNATASALTVSGQTVLTSTNATSHGLDVTWTPVAGTTDALSAARVRGTGTFDTTAGVLLNYGVSSNVSATRSAGANALTNIAMRATASGAQTNIGFQSDAGDNYLNSTSGSTGIGYASGAAIPTKLSVTGAVTVTSGASLNTTNGVTAIGFSTSTASALTVSGASVFSSANDANNAFQVTRTTVAGTTTALSAMRAIAQGTFDTTAGSMTANGIRATSIGTRSAGANNLTNIGGLFSASAAQVNIALQTDQGDVYLNATSGNVGVGYASGASIPAKLSATSTGKAFDVVSTSASTFGGSITWTPVAGTTDARGPFSITANGTLDTTAGALNNRGLTIAVTSARSAGANNLTNKGLLSTASGGQVNIALETTDGSNYLNTTSGSTGIGYASGAALPAKFSVTGAITLTTDLTIGGALAHQGATLGFYNTAPVVKPTIVGSRVANPALASLLTALAGQGLLIDTTTV